jgi:hypothetical protein
VSRTDGTYTATILASAGPEAVSVFLDECRSIPGSSITTVDRTSATVHSQQHHQHKPVLPFLTESTQTPTVVNGRCTIQA